MDLIVLATASLTGAAILGVGMQIGYLLGRRDRQRANPEPVCGCGHHRALHDARGRCAVAVQRKVQRSDAEWRTELADCACQQYIGPEPISSLWTPPVLPESSGR